MLEVLILVHSKYHHFCDADKYSLILVEQSRSREAD